MPRISTKTRAGGAFLLAGAVAWRRRGRRGQSTPVSSVQTKPVPDVRTTPVPGDDAMVAREESAAAAQAGRIGGTVPQQSGDPAMEPLYEAGEGEQDGWEAAEAALIENASHSDGGADPPKDAFTPELESDRSTATYGEADEEAHPDA